MQLWEIIVSVPVSLYTFGCPLVVASQKFYTPDFKTNGFSDARWQILMWMEVIFIIDLIISFLKVPEKMEHPTLRKTAMRYLKTFFIFDFVATVVGGIVFGITQNVLLAAELKLMRIVRMEKIGVSVFTLIRNFINATS